MKPPENIDEYLHFVAIETARMSWPGSMMRGEKQILRGGAKQKVEDYFRNKFPIRNLWDNPASIANKYDEWHRKMSEELSEVIKPFMVTQGNTPEAVAAKILNTYMHQLMKYPKLQIIWPRLHLPLDRKAFNALSKRCVSFAGKEKISDLLEKKRGQPYSINRDEYEQLQAVMIEYLQQLRLNTMLEWSSRIELNWLWL